MRSKIYKLQESGNVLQPYIHFFHIVNRNLRVHFVYNCKVNCANSHVSDNSEYLFNEFFYIMVSKESIYTFTVLLLIKIEFNFRYKLKIKLFLYKYIFNNIF